MIAQFWITWIEWHPPWLAGDLILNWERDFLPRHQVSRIADVHVQYASKKCFQYCSIQHRLVSTNFDETERYRHSRFLGNALYRFVSFCSIPVAIGRADASKMTSLRASPFAPPMACHPHPLSSRKLACWSLLLSLRFSTYVQTVRPVGTAWSDETKWNKSDSKPTVRLLKTATIGLVLWNETVETFFYAYCTYM